MTHSHDHDDHDVHGLHQAQVTSVRDPEHRGRLRVRVPWMHGGFSSGWAMPSTPRGVMPALPRQGATVWVAFEHGDPDFPVWLASAGTSEPTTSESAVMRVGAADPTDEGNDGDYFWNITSGDIFGPKADGAWPVTPTKTVSYA